MLVSHTDDFGRVTSHPGGDWGLNFDRLEDCYVEIQNTAI